MFHACKLSGFQSVSCRLWSEGLLVAGCQFPPLQAQGGLEICPPGGFLKVWKLGEPKINRWWEWFFFICSNQIPHIIELDDGTIYRKAHQIWWSKPMGFRCRFSLKPIQWLKTGGAQNRKLIFGFWDTEYYLSTQFWEKPTWCEN